MSYPSSFHRFSDLPLELRLAIWEHALSGWTVLASSQLVQRSEAGRITDIETTITAVGLTPYLAGFACVESFQLMKKSHSYMKLIFGCRGRISECAVADDDVSGGAYWVDMNRTVLCLDASLHTVHTIPWLHTEALHALRHVVLRWNMERNRDYYHVIKACQLLHNLTLTKDIQTIIVQTVEDTKEPSTVDDSWLSQPTSTATAAYYSTLPDYKGPALTFDRVDCRQLRARLHRFYPYSKIHVLPPISNVGSGSA